MIEAIPIKEDPQFLIRDMQTNKRFLSFHLLVFEVKEIKQKKVQVQDRQIEKNRQLFEQKEYLKTNYQKCRIVFKIQKDQEMMKS